MKTSAVLVGGPLTVIGLMSIVGMFISNGWVRLGLALLVAIGVPAILADRLLPDDTNKGKGIVTDVLAVSWLGFAFVFVVLAISLTRPMLHTEAERQARAGVTSVAELTFWLAGHSGEAAASPDGDKIANADVKPGDKPDAPDKPGDKPDAPDKSGDASAADAGVAAGKPPKNGGKDDPEQPGKEMSPAELFKKWAPSVVTIAVSHGMMGSGGGTGFVIGSDGTIITNHPVIAGSEEVSVKFMDGKYADEVILLAQDKDVDLAILRVKVDVELQPTKLGDSDKVVVGERAISIGNPLGIEHTLTDGLISARRKLHGKRMIQMSTPISPGNSGGPLFNLTGEVIGVSTATMSGGFSGAQNLNLAVPSNAVKAMLKDDYPDQKKIGGGGPNVGRW